MGFNTQNWRSCAVTRAANQSLTSGAAAALSWDAAVHNPNGLWSSGVNPSRITIDKPGLYRVTAKVDYAAAVDNAASVVIKVSGTAKHTKLAGVAFTAAGGQVISGDVLCVIGDYIEVFALQTSGGGVNATGSCSVNLVHPQQDWSADTEAV